LLRGKNQQGRGHSTSIFYLKQKGRETLMEVLKDKDCTINTPVVLGVQDSPIYGKGISIKPRVDGRKDSKHFESIYLPELLPLEEYDLIVVLISGGKDSIACFYKLLELGVPKEKIELWHHDIDGGHPSRRMDWKCTQNYMKALADAEGVKLRVSYRVNGFFGELYRIGASEPIEWIDPDPQGEGLGIAPIDHIVKVKTATNVKVNVTTSLTFDEGYSFNTLKSTITDTISAYLKEIRSQWANYSQSVVRISQIETRLLGIKGIVDISNTKINGVASNLTLDKYEIPVMGGVSG
jgi:baseplate J-like protein